MGNSGRRPGGPRCSEPVTELEGPSTRGIDERQLANEVFYARAVRYWLEHVIE
ncbi:hypothetical protein ACFQMM_23295 [Saliphagus sp. GCM10025308]